MSVNSGAVEKVVLKKEPSENLSFAKDFVGSLMFDPKEINILNDVLGLISDPDFNKKTAEPAGQGNSDAISSDLEAMIKISPSFFVNSIIYEDGDSWTIWLNKRKFNSKKQNELQSIIENLKIEYIKKEEICFSFETAFLKRLSPKWEQILKTEKGKFVSQDAQIMVEQNSQGLALVKFKLLLNQTFVLHEMKIVEGFAPSVTLPELKKESKSKGETIQGIASDLMRGL